MLSDEPMSVELMINSLLNAVKNEIKFDRINCWSDSQIALWWIKQSRKEWKPWVENRVSKIRSYVKPEYWRYARTNSNPADLLTRKAASNDLHGNLFWWNGPEFLQKK